MDGEIDQQRVISFSPLVASRTVQSLAFPPAGLAFPPQFPFWFLIFSLISKSSRLMQGTHISPLFTITLRILFIFVVVNTYWNHEIYTLAQISLFSSVLVHGTCYVTFPTAFILGISYLACAEINSGFFPQTCCYVWLICRCSSKLTSSWVGLLGGDWIMGLRYSD